MEKYPLVSIVVVSYNHASYLVKNLDTIKAQTYSNIELILADDASSDNSVEVFEQWLVDNQYPAIKNYHTQNKGLAATLNECIAMLNGKYVKLISGDDYLHPEAIEKSVEKLESLGEEYGMVFCDTYTVNDRSELIEDYADYDSLGLIDPLKFRDELIKGCRIAALTTMMHKRVILETGPYDTKYIVEDYYRWLMINEKYLIGYIPQKLYYYRLHDNNLSVVKKERIAQEGITLSIRFDKKGVAHNRVNSFIQERYIQKQEISPELFEAYTAYPYKNKILYFFLKNKLPIIGYKLIRKFTGYIVYD